MLICCGHVVMKMMKYVCDMLPDQACTRCWLLASSSSSSLLVKPDDFPLMS
jgi:hypothetical protein